MPQAPQVSLPSLRFYYRSYVTRPPENLHGALGGSDVHASCTPDLSLSALIHHNTCITAARTLRVIRPGGSAADAPEAARGEAHEDSLTQRRA